MKKILVAVVLLCGLSTVARADEASRRAQAEKLVGLMHMDRMMDQMTGMIKAQSAQMLQDGQNTANFNATQQKLMTEFQGKLMDMTLSELSWKKMEPLMVNVYAKSFSEEELDGMVTFYSSPVGQSVLEKMPQVMQNSMQLMQGDMMELMPKVQAMAKDYGAKIKAAGDSK